MSRPASPASPASALRRLPDAIPPASGAVVMGTGIVSIALLLDGERVLSAVLLVLAAIAWLALAVLLPARALRDRRRFAADLRHPAALTAIAGTEVLGTRLTLAGWSWAGVALLIVGALIWLALVPHVLRHWQTPTIGASFILTVATESLALLAATVAFAEHAGWLVWAALVPLCLGLCFYALVLARFDFHQLVTGAGDHWVTGGALAISTVAAGRIALTAQRTSSLTGAHDALNTIALVLWCLTMIWLPALLVAELLRPRLFYDVRRWSTVFPVGMYAVCSFTVGETSSVHLVTAFARVWVWFALAVWLLVAAGLARAAATLTGLQGSTERERGRSRMRQP